MGSYFRPVEHLLPVDFVKWTLFAGIDYHVGNMKSEKEENLIYCKISKVTDVLHSGTEKKIFKRKGTFQTDVILKRSFLI